MLTLEPVGPAGWIIPVDPMLATGEVRAGAVDDPGEARGPRLLMREAADAGRL